MLHLEQMNILGGYGLKGEYDILYTFMSCALEVNSNGRCKWEHVESCRSTIKNIIFPRPYCLWSPKLASQ